MLNTIRRWLSSEHAARTEWSDVADWAGEQGYVFKRSRDGGGFAIEGQFESREWRLEWGPSQRFYIAGHEVRLRLELGVAEDLQMLVLSRALMDQLETSTFETYTDSLKTYADDAAPEEMRWLAMFGKLDGGSLGPLRSHYGALALMPPAAESWLNAGLGGQLLRYVAAGVAGADRPLVLMVQRGRVSLRAALSVPGPLALAGWLALFQVAVQGVPAAAARVEQLMNERSTGSRRSS